MISKNLTLIEIENDTGEVLPLLDGARGGTRVRGPRRQHVVGHLTRPWR